MSERGLHTIEDDLSETWVEDWAAVGLAEIEALLAKHAAFLGYLETPSKTSKPGGLPAAPRRGNARRVKFEWLYRGTPGPSAPSAAH